MRTGRSPSRVSSICSSGWPVSTCSPAATWTVATVPSAGAQHLVLHLHRLDDDQRLAGDDRVAGRDEHAQHGAGHRRHERAGRDRRRRDRGSGGARVNVTWPSCAVDEALRRRTRPTRERAAQPAVVEHDDLGRRPTDDRRAERRAVDGRGGRRDRARYVDADRRHRRATSSTTWSTAPGCCASRTGSSASTARATAVGGLLGQRAPRGGDGARRRGSASVHGNSSRKPVCRSPATNAGCVRMSSSWSRLVTGPCSRRRREPRVELADRLGAGRPVGDDLGDHRVVERLTRRARLDAGVDPDARGESVLEAVRTCRSTGGSRRPGPRRQPGLDRVAVERGADEQRVGERSRRRRSAAGARRGRAR